MDISFLQLPSHILNSNNIYFYILRREEWEGVWEIQLLRDDSEVWCPFRKVGGGGRDEGEAISARRAGSGQRVSGASLQENMMCDIS